MKYTPLLAESSSVEFLSNVKFTFPLVKVPPDSSILAENPPSLQNCLRTIQPERFSLVLFHLNKTLIFHLFLGHSRNAHFRGNYIPGPPTPQKFPSPRKILTINIHTKYKKLNMNTKIHIFADMSLKLLY